MKLLSDAINIRRQTEEKGSKIRCVIVIIIIIIIIIIYVPYMFVIDSHLA